MKRCQICEVELGTLTCRHVGPLCFECWGSGIHEAIKRKEKHSSDLWKEFVDHVLQEIWIAICEGTFDEIAGKYGISPIRSGVIRRAVLMTEREAFPAEEVLS